MKDFFNAIEDLFDVLFIPFDTLAELELENWFAANAVSWLFILIGFAALVYWMLQLKKYSATDKEDKSITAHSYL
ncbi:uracil phosphoribosyltransferase [Oceanihabitans sp. IOP_32]|uniref:DUF6341 family protein n=1 Tax=Oceanihabitans sp. IOP_32 TaxID=2529032 RepID=UPI001293323B|nr:uracil phosphoribosyltransferase [Oceanihabitans sp. IOP_32]QFZ54422.1 uracil phosphoribosyltransferase [Oceanihabitans sp. IOP_32]